MTSLGFMITIPAPGEKGSKEHRNNRDPISMSMMMRMMTSGNSGEEGDQRHDQYIFPSYSDSGSVTATPTALPQKSKQPKEKVSASRLRSLRRDRLLRDKLLASGSFGGEYKFVDGDDSVNDQSTGSFCSASPLSSSQECIQIEPHGDDGENSDQQHPANLFTYYHRLESAMQDFSAMVETISSEWCSNGNENDEIVRTVQQQLEEEKDDENHDLVTCPTDQSDPYDIIHDPQLAAIMKKNRLRYRSYNFHSYDADTTHLRALEIVGRNKYRATLYQSDEPHWEPLYSKAGVTTLYQEESSIAYFQSHPAI